MGRSLRRNAQGGPPPPEAAARAILKDCIYWADNHFRRLKGRVVVCGVSAASLRLGEATARAVLQTAFVRKRCNADDVESAANVDL